MIPGRFGEGALRAEAGMTALNLLTYYHDMLLHKVPPSAKQPLCFHPLAKALSVLELVQLWCEMFALKKSGSEKTRWRVVLLIETAKASMRLLLLQHQGGKMLIPAKISPNKRDPLQALRDNPAFAAAMGGAKANEQEGEEAEEQKELFSFSQFHSVLAQKRKSGATSAGSKYLSLSELSPNSIESVMQFTEVLTIIKPVIYAWALSKWGKASFKPLSIALVLEFLIHRADQQLLTFGNTTEKTEVSRRRRAAVLFYLFRSPVYEGATRRVVQAGLWPISVLPFIGQSFSNILLELADSFSAFHFRI
eukprot:TRINITY_DN5568_c0_g1_i2.p1 TRINITY_DN5568_c0_g1~~TRINITY_DN5568_c0_g1_i2.p1  ORF type:complete len:341 (-),score=83.64 TRINITY_DN5568_c0_g1_i2:7-927(-)